MTFAWAAGTCTVSSILTPSFQAQTCKMSVKVCMSRVSTRLKAPWGLHPEVQVNLSTVALPYEVAFDPNGSFENGQVSFEEKTTQGLPQIPTPGTIVRD